MRRRVASGVLAFVVLLGGGMPSQAAEFTSTYVIPGKAGVPVIINGVDASYTVVEGEFGLSRPGHVTPTIVTPPLWGPAPGIAGSYFPARGVQPGYGRREIEPPANRRLPPPAPSFHRQWSTQSEAAPAAIDPPATVPPMIIEPQIGLRKPPLRRPTS
jgi:hypothetical protein